MQEKPSASKYEALTFIASWLLENNPNKPRVVPDTYANYDDEEEDDEAEFKGVSRPCSPCCSLPGLIPDLLLPGLPVAD